MQVKRVDIIRWFFVPLAAIGGCAGGLTIASATPERLRQLVGPEGVYTLGTDVCVGLAYALAAFLFVLLGMLAAPRDRTVTAVGLFLAGAALAWIPLGTWFFPEGHPRAYQISRAPFILTLAGGLFAVVVTMLLSRRWRRRDRAGGATSPGLPPPSF